MRAAGAAATTPGSVTSAPYHDDEAEAAGLPPIRTEGTAAGLDPDSFAKGEGQQSVPDLLSFSRRSRLGPHALAFPASAASTHMPASTPCLIPMQTARPLRRRCPRAVVPCR